MRFSFSKAMKKRLIYIWEVKFTKATLSKNVAKQNG